MYTNVASNCYR